MTLVLVVWWIGLLGALLLTALVLKQASLLLRLLRDLERLADRTAAAARGIVENVAPVPDLPAAYGDHQPLVGASARLHGAAAAFEQAVTSELGPSPLGRLGARITGWLAGRQSKGKG